MNYSVSKNRDGIFWSLIFRDRRNRDGKFPSLFPSLFSIRDGIPSLFSVSILQFSCSVSFKGAQITSVKYGDKALEKLILQTVPR